MCFSVCVFVYMFIFVFKFYNYIKFSYSVSFSSYFRHHPLKEMTFLFGKVCDDVRPAQRGTTTATS